MVERKDEDSSPLLTDYYSSTTSSSSISDDFEASDVPLKRTGNVWTATAHIITAVIGSGVLSLAWSMAQLGWIAGPLSILIMAVVAIVSSHLLSDCYRSPDPVHGPIRHYSYPQAVKMNLGEKLPVASLGSSGFLLFLGPVGYYSLDRKRSGWLCSLFIYEAFYGFAIAYTITSAISMRAIQKSNCYHREGHAALCSYGDELYMLLFGAVQVLLSQIPKFCELKWLSIIAAAMSFCYSTVAIGLGFAKVIGNGEIKGSIDGIPTGKASEKLWLVAQALGDIAFSYNFSTIVLEIENTVSSPPPENKTMKQASTVGMILTTFFYICCGCFGYAAFGENTPGNLLTGFGFYEPYWLIDFANACIVLHLIGAYQVFTQPLFAATENFIINKFPDSEFVNSHYTVKLPLTPAFGLNPLRLCFRTVFVISTTGISMSFPYFNQILGVAGALNFWPLAIYFPVEMYLVRGKVRAWTKQWVFWQAFRIISLFGTIFALVGSIQGLLTAS